MVQVDIERLFNTSGTIRYQNGRIRDAFQVPMRAVSEMDAEWNGSASQNAMQAFYKICQYTTPRYNVLESLAKAMETVANGYGETEETNVSLAARFK